MKKLKGSVKCLGKQTHHVILNILNTFISSNLMTPCNGSFFIMNFVSHFIAFLDTVLLTSYMCLLHVRYHSNGGRRGVTGYDFEKLKQQLSNSDTGSETDNNFIEKMQKIDTSIINVLSLVTLQYQPPFYMKVKM